jgi:hypothetical protein
MKRIDDPDHLDVPPSHRLEVNELMGLVGWQAASERSL